MFFSVPPGKLLASTWITPWPLWLFTTQTLPKRSICVTYATSLHSTPWQLIDDVQWHAEGRLARNKVQYTNDAELKAEALSVSVRWHIPFWRTFHHVFILNVELSACYLKATSMAEAAGPQETFLFTKLQGIISQKTVTQPERILSYHARNL